MAKKFQKFRVALSGTTVDGRTIDDKMLTEMAQDYNPATYTARINMEHIRGFSPDGPFNAYGDIAALSVEPVDVQIGGRTEKRLALFAEGTGLDNLETLAAKGQKVFPSIEIEPNFAGKGRAYLMGLAVTDSPASVGTERLQFTVNAIKARGDNMFTPFIESELRFEDEPPPQPGMAEMFKAFLEKFSGGTPTPPVQSQQPPAPQGQQQLSVSADTAGLAALTGLIGQFVSSTDAAFKSQGERFDRLSGDIAALKQQVEKTPDPNHHSRPLSNGSSANLNQVF